MNARHDAPVRLSRWVFFVDYDDHVEVHHVLADRTWRTDLHTAHVLKHWAGFRLPDVQARPWLDRAVLVPAGAEPLFAPQDSPLGDEAALGAAWQGWYWKREVEAEREYRWLGEVVLKMPEDLFLYQELLSSIQARRVLEIGSGHGGGLWFFASMLAALDGGLVVGVERDRPAREPSFDRFPTVRVEMLEGDGHDPRLSDRVRELAPEFDLIVIDADPSARGKLALLEHWAPFVAPSGFIALEDLSSPECRADARILNAGLDSFLERHGAFINAEEARRMPTHKQPGGVLRRLARRSI